MTEQIVPILRTADAHAAAAWYARLGFIVEGEHTFGPGMPVFMYLARGEVRIYLSEHLEDAPENGLAYLWVDDIASIADEFGVEVSEAPWALETDLTDPDGNRLRLGQKPSDPD